MHVVNIGILSKIQDIKMREYNLKTNGPSTLNMSDVVFKFFLIHVGRRLSFERAFSGYIQLCFTILKYALRR